MSNPPVGTVLIVGMSSGLGTAIAAGLVAARPTTVIGTYRRWNRRLESARNTYEGAGLALSLRCLDVSDHTALIQLAADVCRVAPTDEPITLVYCCGAFISGRVANLSAAQFDEAIAVGLRGPCLAICEMARTARCPLRILIVSGLGGDRTATEGNGIYALVTSGLYAFTRATAAEFAGSCRTCTVVSLGLFDKGQAGLDRLASRLNIGRPLPIDHAARFVCRLVTEPDTMLNGAVIEFAGGLQGYRDVIALNDAHDVEHR
jgi:NAD(P)-dependent dehydrogenase (short-subunit alcohol dehydrogenase family)